MMIGTCTKCGHEEPPISADPGTVKFGKQVVRVASQMSGVSQSNILGKYGVKEYRDVRAGVCRYLRHRGLIWDKCARALGRKQGADAYAMANNWHSDRAVKTFEGLKKLLGDGS